jgi:D-threo-aldose 1-dehydrogenase
MPTRLMKLSAAQYRPLGKTGLRVPPIVFGAAAIGNASRVLPQQTREAICCEWFRHVEPPVAIDVAENRGGCLALETIGRLLCRLEIPPEDVIISLKIGGPNQTVFDLDQAQLFDRFVTRWEECCRQLGGQHRPRLVSLSGLDEYLAAATSATDRDRRQAVVLEAYRSLQVLKASGQAAGIGLYARDWRIVQTLVADMSLAVDGILLSRGLTLLHHPPELLDFVAVLQRRGIGVIHSGVFHAGFLLGRSNFEGRLLHADDPADRSLIAWRKSFVALCEGHGVRPTEACIHFVLRTPGISAVALETSRPDRIAELVAAVLRKPPDSFWASLKEEGLLAANLPHLGTEE